MFRRSILASVRFVGLFFSIVATASAQSYSPMYSPLSTQPQNFVCLDQYNHPVPYAYFFFYTGVYLYTNAHLHDDSSHPWSPGMCNARYSYQCLSSTDGYADATGAFSLDLFPTLTGQAEALVIACANPNGYVQRTFNYAVGYNDLIYNDDPNVWVKIGGTDTGANTGHGSTAYNRYMQNTPSWQIWYATLDYLSAHPEITKVCLNDQALQYGGKFDICALNPPNRCTGQYNPDYRPWLSPHQAHDRGTAADVAGTGSSQCTDHGGSGVNIPEFIQRCIDHNAYAANSINEGNHAHCQFGDINAWPH